MFGTRRSLFKSYNSNDGCYTGSMLRAACSMRPSGDRLLRLPGTRQASALSRELPGHETNYRRSAAYIALICALGGAIAVAFNHQKSSNSLTHSTYYALRRDPAAIAILGPNIRYSQSWPWITGVINQNRGIIDIAYSVRGDINTGIAHFHCIRDKKSTWDILEWSLAVPGEGKIMLSQDTDMAQSRGDTEDSNVDSV